MCDCRESATLLVRARHNLSTSCVIVRSGVLLGGLFGWCAEARSESFDDIEGFLTLEQDAAWTVNWHCLVSNGDVVATLDPSLQSIRPSRIETAQPYFGTRALSAAALGATSLTKAMIPTRRTSRRRAQACQVPKMNPRKAWAVAIQINMTRIDVTISLSVVYNRSHFDRASRIAPSPYI